MSASNIISKLFIYPVVAFVGVVDVIISYLTKVDYTKFGVPSNKTILTKPVDKNDLSLGFRSTLSSDLYKIEEENHNLYEEFKTACDKYPTKNALGTRKKLKITEAIQPDGKKIKKFLQSNQYEWIKFNKVLEMVDNLSNGLLASGLKSNENIVINCETRPEWLISALACMKIKVPIVTLYATLGVEALQFGIQQTDTKFLIISGEQISKVEKILEELKTVTHIIVICDEYYSQSLISFREKAKKSGINVEEFKNLLKLGESTALIDDYERPNKDDLAIVMYTSGSTGNPKGAMISHGNLLLSSRTLRERMSPLDKRFDVYIGYLPLAHVLELCTEFIVLNGGIPVGYSSPFTITDASTGIIKGELGDLRVLNPSIMHSVPAVLEKLSKAVKLKISSKSNFFQTLFAISFEQKHWLHKAGIETKLLDWILFNRISSIVIGKKLKFLMCAGALLSEEVHKFVEICLCPVRQAYGLTETLACGSTQLINTYETGNNGSIVPCVEIRLVDWNEGEYRLTDKPYPRGEICIGGDNVIKGYYQMPEKTKEDFHVINGIRFFSTGDIGEMNTDKGTLKIIDRKKDIVKLSGGEYVSLNKVESLMKLLPYVDNCCLIASSLKSYTVCLVCPNQNKFIEIFKESTDMHSFKIETFEAFKTDIEKNKYIIEILESNMNLVSKLTNEVINHCLKNNVARFEAPKKIKFVPEIWLPDTGLVTDSLKIKRVQIDKYYKSEISKIYT